MRALEEMQYWLISWRKFIVETDMSYIFGMLKNPDYTPNTTINHWTEKILMFHFTLRHKKGKTFGADGLSRRDLSPKVPLFANSEHFEDEPVGPLMALQNMDSANGICNGTHVILSRSSHHVLEVRVLGGEM